jgi:hypothetical protein
MDINITNPVSAAIQSYKTPQVTTANTGTPAPVTTTQPSQQVKSSVANDNASAKTVSIDDVQAQYEAAVRQAILSFKNTYAVSDKEFAIFKDASGQLITRYVSLRDGTVTYVPAPTFVRDIHAILSTEFPLQISIEA